MKNKILNIVSYVIIAFTLFFLILTISNLSTDYRFYGDEFYGLRLVSVSLILSVFLHGAIKQIQKDN